MSISPKKVLTIKYYDGTREQVSCDAYSLGKSVITFYDYKNLTGSNRDRIPLGYRNLALIEAIDQTTFERRE